MSASTDSSQAHNELGPGLTRTSGGMIRVTDPTQAYMWVDADGSSPYWKIDTVSVEQLDQLGNTFKQAPVSNVHIRVECDGTTSPVESGSLYSPRSLYFSFPAKGRARVWIEEAQYAVTTITAIRANIRVPFSFNFAQVCTMLAVFGCIAALLPRSWLWRTQLNTKTRSQRILFALACAPMIIYTLVQSFWMFSGEHIAAFHDPNGYTFDFDQYDHIATALLQGHAWLDLPLSPEFAALDNPYDTAARSELLASNISPIYWDYAFYDGHWYSYFGVLPALVLFLPFRVITSLFTPGGIPLPAGVAELVLMCAFTVVCLLMVIRLLQRTLTSIRLGTVALTSIMVLIGSNAMYLWFRTNFYSIPIAASLLLVCAGVLCWLRATRDPEHLRMRSVVFGALWMSLTLACRPTFILTGLLALPFFWPYARRMMHTHNTRALCTLLAALAIPLLAVCIPVGIYNYVRFGSLTDFGNAYQITVTDMTQFHTPISNMPYTLWYYLLLPLHTQSSFPWIAISPTVLPQWSFAEYSVCGLFVLMPCGLLAFALPWFKRSAGRLWPTLMTMLALAIILLVFDSLVGGFGWRYIADFGWLFMLAALIPCAHLMERFAWMRGVIVLIIGYALTITVLSCFVIGREDQLIINATGLYYNIRSWFTLI